MPRIARRPGRQHPHHSVGWVGLMARVGEGAPSCEVLSRLERRWWLILALLVFGVVPPGVRAQDPGADEARSAVQDRPAVHLIAHSSVEINDSAAAIWPHILNPLPWKQGLRLRLLAGTADQVGALYGGFAEQTPEVIELLLQDIEMEPERRRTVKLMGPDGTLQGFATWTLEERDGSTRVAYDVTSESTLPRGQVDGLDTQTLARMERELYAASQRRFDSELAALKRLVEGSE